MARDAQAAARFFRLSAERGSPVGQYSYAVVLSRGEGVEEDLAEAYYWARKAEAGGPTKQVEYLVSTLIFATSRALTEADAAAVHKRLAAEGIVVDE